MSELSSTKEEVLRRKIDIIEASMEGARHRLEDYNPEDKLSAGLFWAFIELKEAASDYLDDQ